MFTVSQKELLIYVIKGHVDKFIIPMNDLIFERGYLGEIHLRDLVEMLAQINIYEC